MTDVRVVTTEDAISGETEVRSITVFTFSGTVTPAGGGGGGAVDSVNGETGTVVLSASDVGAVPTTRTVNGKALSANISLTASDVGAGTSNFDGAYSSLTGKPTLGTAAAKDIPGTGNASSTQVVYGTDTRLSDSRTPTAHASSHASAGSDPITIAESQVTNLVTDLAGKAASTHTHAESDVTGLVTDLAGKVPTTRTVAGHALSADVTVSKSDVGLGNVDNTADTAKPVSTAQQTALDLKANLASPALTGNPTAPTQTAGNNSTRIATTAYVDGTFAPLASPALTGNPTVPTQTAGTNSTRAASTAYADNAVAKQQEVLMFALGDETTAITTGTKVTFRMPFAMTLTSVRASLTTASSSGNPAFDVKESGTTIFSTALTIDATEKTSQTAATAAVLSDTSLADDAEITLIVSTAGTGAAGAKITFIGTRT